MALAFAAPLVLTAFEAAGQIVARAGGGAAKAAPGWLALVDIGGLLAIVWGIADQASRAEDRPSFVARGVMFALIYVVAMLLLAGTIDWRPYRV